MTRKDYKLIARALKAGLGDHINSRFSEWMDGHQRAVESIAKALAVDNPNFKRGDFYNEIYGKMEEY